MNVFVIGAAGGIGNRLARLLTARGDTVTGMHRNPAQAETVRNTGAGPVSGDLIEDTVDQLAEKISGHDAVVFSAGAHGTGMDKTTLIDGRGLEKAATAAVQAGVSRFVLVSVFPGVYPVIDSGALSVVVRCVPGWDGFAGLPPDRLWLRWRSWSARCSRGFRRCRSRGSRMPAM